MKSTLKKSLFSVSKTEMQLLSYNKIKKKSNQKNETKYLSRKIQKKEK